MEIYLDSANLQEIKAAKNWGIIDGVTTNPTLIKKEVERLQSQGQSIDMKEHIQSILATAGEGVPVSLEVTGTDYNTMVAQGKKLHIQFNLVAHNVVVKIPVNTSIDGQHSFDGIKAIKMLESVEIPVNATLVMTPEQALLAAKAGATYVSPFLGREDDYLRDSVEMEYNKQDYYPAEGEDTADDEEDLDDNGIVSGVDLVTKITEIFEKHEIDCNVLSASIRNTRQVRECALAGSDIATLPFQVLKMMVFHRKTQEGIKKFTADIEPAYASLLGDTVPAKPTSEQPAQPAQTPQPQPAPAQPLQQPVQPQPSPQPQQQPNAFDLARR